MRKGKRSKKDRFEPRKTRVNGELYWQINLPKHPETGKRQRETFRDLERAKARADQARIQYKNFGTAAFSMSDQLRTEATRAEEILRPYGKTVLEAARFLANHLARTNKSETVKTVVKEFLEAKEGDNLRPRYLGDLRARLNRFSESFSDRKIAELSAGDIDAWLRGLHRSPLTRNTFRLRLSTLFAYANSRGWCQTNPIGDVKKVKPSSSPIEILTPEEFNRLLEVSSDETLPYWLLGGFAGLRRAEIERLEWKDIHFDLAKYRAFIQAAASGDKEKLAKAEKEWRKSALVEVPALKAKTASRRFVQIRDNLAAWLERYIGKTGNVCPANLRKLLENDRVKTGIWIGPENDEEDEHRIERPAGKLKPWPSNGLRHSFASYHLAHFENAALLALELGHSGGQDLLFRHYRELVKPEQAEKYWNIRPVTETHLVAISA
jgi:integrase